MKPDAQRQSSEGAAEQSFDPVEDFHQAYLSGALSKAFHEQAKLDWVPMAELDPSPPRPLGSLRDRGQPEPTAVQRAAVSDSGDSQPDSAGPPLKLNCRPGDLAVVLHDEPTCASNIGHIVRVHGPMAMTKDLGATWLILPVGRRKWAVHNRDGTFRKMVVRLRDRIEHSDAWLMPLRDDDVSGVAEEEELGMDSPAVMRSMQAKIDQHMIEIGAVVATPVNLHCGCVT